MSQENVKVVRRAFELVEEGARRSDPGWAFDEAIRKGLVAAGIELKLGVRGGVGVAGISDKVGRGGWVDFMRSWAEDFDRFAIEAEQITDIGDGRVLALVRNYGTGRASGATVEARFGAVYTLEAGCIVRMDVFAEPSHALHAVGLSE